MSNAGKQASTEELRRRAAEVIEKAEELRLQSLSFKQTFLLTAQRMQIRRALIDPWPMASRSHVIPRSAPRAALADPSQVPPAKPVAPRELAARLHDDVAQLLALCEMRLSSVSQNAEVSQARKYLSRAIEATRSVIQGGDAVTPSNTCMVAALEQIAAEMVEYGLVVTVTQRRAPGRVEDGVVSTLCRCVRELLFNTIKHSGVLKADVVLSFWQGTLGIQVIDKGKGFRASRLQQHVKAKGGYGLSHARRSLTELGGILNVASNPGQGATVTLSVPVA